MVLNVAHSFHWSFIMDNIILEDIDAFVPFWHEFRNSSMLRGKLNSCIRIHSRIAVYTSSLLWTRRPSKCCFTGPDIWSVARCDPLPRYCNLTQRVSDTNCWQLFHWKLLDCPPQSRDFAPSDCYLFGSPEKKKQLGSRRFSSSEEV